MRLQICGNRSRSLLYNAIRTAASCLLVCLPSLAVAQIRIDLPQRVDPWRMPEPSMDSIALWRFEGDAKDAGPAQQSATLVGKPEFDKQGRYGQALRTTVPQDGILAREVTSIRPADDKNGSFSVDFWIKPAEDRSRSACLFELGSTGRTPTVRLLIDKQGGLTLIASGLPETESNKRVPSSEWSHIAITEFLRYQANDIYIDAAGIQVLLNGEPVIVAETTDRYRFLPGTVRGDLSIANSLNLTEGFDGSIDEVHIASIPRSYFRRIEQSWLAPQATPLQRSKKYYRAVGESAHYSFENETSLLALKKQMPVVKQTAKEDVADALLDAIDLGKPKSDPLGEDKLKVAEVVKKILPGYVKTVPGVRGNAIEIARAPQPLRIDLPSQQASDGGTLEFWFKPGDWDSLTPPLPPKSPYAYRNGALPMITLYGEPKSGRGDPEPLISMSLRLYQGPDYEFAFQPHQWSHAMLVWGPELPHYQPWLFLDGRMVGYSARTNRAKKAPPEVWETHRPAYITIGNNRETAYDEIRLYPYPFSNRETSNALAEYRGEPMQEVGAALCEFTYDIPLGTLDISLQVMLLDAKRVHHASLKFSDSDKSILRTVENVEISAGRGMVHFQGLAELPVGTYQVTGTLFDSAGQSITDYSGAFEREPTPWLGNDIGIAETPPAPYLPVQVEAENQISVVDRVYQIGKSGFFDAITVRGEQILAEPIRLQTAAGTISPQPAQFKLGKHSATAADWTAGNSGDPASGKLSYSLKSHLEYDGMTRFELELRPQQGSATVDSLALKIPLTSKYAELIHVLPIDGNFRGYEVAGALPQQEGMLWDSLTWHSKSKAVAKRPLGNFVPMVWLGGKIRGLCWFADNDQGWIPSNEHASASVERSGYVTTLTLNLIPGKFTLKEPRQITFGLLATPPKPLPKNHRVWNRGNSKKYGPIAGRLHSCDSFAPWEVPARTEAFDFWPTNYDWKFAEAASAQQRKSKHSKYVDGKALMLYHDKRFLPVDQHAAYFRSQWWANKNVSFPPSRVDSLVWYMDQWFGRNIMDGVYIDDVFPVADYNIKTGTAYELPDGTVQPGSPMFGYRDYLKRTYTLMSEHGKQPLITTHMTSTLAMPFHSFVTFIYDCEDQGRFMGDTDITFIDAWPLDRLLTLDNPERTGLVTWPMLKDTYATRERPEAGYMKHVVRRTYRSAAAIWLLFDMNVDRLPETLPAAMEPWLQPEIAFHPFWRNESLVKVEPVAKKPLTSDEQLPAKRFWRKPEFRAAIGKQPFRASLYMNEEERKAMLVVVNFAKVPQYARVELALPSDMKVKDVDTWPEIAEGSAEAREELDPAVALGGPKGVKKNTNALLDDIEKEADPDKDPKHIRRPAGNKMELRVNGHDFRLIEISW